MEKRTERNLETVGKDVGGVILDNLDDRSLFKFCMTSESSKNLCNEDYFRRRTLNRYPATLTINKDTGEKQPSTAPVNWKKHYLETVIYVDKLQTDFNYKYIDETDKNPKFLYILNEAFNAMAMKDANLGEFTKEKGLLVASLTGALILVKYLVALDIDVSYENYAALLFACRQGRLNTLRYLIEQAQHLPVNFRDALLLFAAEDGYYNIVEYLSQLGIPVTIQDNLPIILASQNGWLKTVSVLTELGADVNAQHDTPLIEAAMRGHVPVLEYLIGRGVDVQTMDNEALLIAVISKKLPVVKYLIDHGADISARNNQALEVAAEMGNLQMVKLLVEHGADISANNDRALKLAVRNDHEDVIDYLGRQESYNKLINRLPTGKVIKRKD